MVPGIEGQGSGGVGRVARSYIHPDDIVDDATPLAGPPQQVGRAASSDEILSGFKKLEDVYKNRTERQSWINGSATLILLPGSLIALAGFLGFGPVAVVLGAGIIAIGAVYWAIASFGGFCCFQIQKHQALKNLEKLGINLTSPNMSNYLKSLNEKVKLEDELADLKGKLSKCDKTSQSERIKEITEDMTQLQQRLQNVQDIMEGDRSELMNMQLRRLITIGVAASSN